MKQLFSFLLIVFLALVGCMKDPAGFSDNDKSDNENTIPVYPSTIMKLSESELQSAEAEFNDLKGEEIIAELDAYGLVDYAGNLVRGNSNITEAETAISQARDILIRLGKFTNVNDSTLFETKEVTNQHGSGLFNDWIITFENQMYNGLEVMNTEVMVLVGDEVRQISGHHYTNIMVPEDDAIGATEAGQLLVGYQIDYVCWTPSTYIVTEASVNYSKIEKVVYPFHFDDRIEFRVAWKIPIGDSISIPDWYIYMDVMLGEILLIEQTFVC